MDITFTVAVINSVNVVFWRCVWELQDLLILPDDEETSAIVSLVAGYVLVVLCYTLQYPFDMLSRRLRKIEGRCAFLCLLLLSMVFTFLAALTSITVWRGFWMNYQFHLWPSELYYSYWIGHGVGFIGLSLFGGATHLPVRGAIIDADKGKGSLSIDFFRIYFAKYKSISSSKVTSNDGTPVSISISTIAWMEVIKLAPRLTKRKDCGNVKLNINHH